MDKNASNGTSSTSTAPVSPLQMPQSPLSLTPSTMGAGSSGRGLVTNSTLHKQVSMIVGILKRNPLDASICQRALRALLLVLREDGAACCRQYEEVLVANLIPPLIAHPEDLSLCETALSTLAILSESTTLSRSESGLCSVLIYLLELHAEHTRQLYLLLCILNNLAIDSIAQNLRPRLTSVFTKLLGSAECARDSRLCATLLGAICNCSQCISPASEELVGAVVDVLRDKGGDTDILRVASMVLGNFVHQGEPATSAVLESCAVGRIAGFLRGNCRATASAAEGSSPSSSSASLYAILAEIIGDIVAESCATKNTNSPVAMEVVAAALLDVVRTRIGGAKASIQALRALRILCASISDIRRFVVQNSGVEIVLGVAKENFGRTALCMGAMRALQNMVLLEDAQELARKEGAIEFSGEMLKAFTKAPKACYYALRLATSLVICDENKERAKEAGLVELIIDAITYHKNTDARICEQGCLALSVIITNCSNTLYYTLSNQFIYFINAAPTNQEIALRRGAVDLLTNVLNDFSGINYRVCMAACQALQQVVTHDDFPQIMEEVVSNAHDATCKLIMSIAETMNMNSGDTEYCMQASKTLVNITSKKVECSEHEWVHVVELVEEMFCINQGKLSASDTLSAVLLNVYAHYAHEILASPEKRDLCVLRTLDVLRYYRGNKYICATSLTFLEGMLDGSCGTEPSDEVRFLLWKEGLSKMLGSALLIHEADSALCNRIKNVLEKVGNNVFSDWLRHIGAIKGTYKKEFEYAEVVTRSKSKSMFNGVFSYPVVLDQVTSYEAWRNAGFIISKPNIPLYWERFVSTNFVEGITLTDQPEGKEEINDTRDNQEPKEGETTEHSREDENVPINNDAIDGDMNENTLDAYTLLSESKDFFAEALSESPESFERKIEKASNYVSYMTTDENVTSQLSEWGMSGSDALAVTFYRLDFALATLGNPLRFSSMLNAAPTQAKTEEQLSAFSNTPTASFCGVLKRAIAKTPCYEGKVYHVFHMDSRNDFKTLAKSGALFAWSGIISTLTDFETAKKLCLNNDYTLASISAKHSHKINIFTPFPALRDEDEALILPTLTFKVSKDTYWDYEHKLYCVDFEEV